MDDLKPQRQRFQFSLRKLLLWTAVWAACLSTFRFMLRYFTALNIPDAMSLAVGLTIYLGVLLPIRIKWGSERGARIAVLGTVLALACWAEVTVAVDYLTGQSFGYLVEAQLAIAVLASITGLFLSAVGFVFVHILVTIVDWLDNVMRTKTPQDQ